MRMLSNQDVQASVRESREQMRRRVELSKVEAPRLRREQKFREWGRPPCSRSRSVRCVLRAKVVETSSNIPSCPQLYTVNTAASWRYRYGPLAEFVAVNRESRRSCRPTPVRARNGIETTSGELRTDRVFRPQAPLPEVGQRRASRCGPEAQEIRRLSVPQRIVRRRLRTRHEIPFRRRRIRASPGGGHDKGCASVPGAAQAVRQVRSQAR